MFLSYQPNQKVLSALIKDTKINIRLNYLILKFEFELYKLAFCITLIKKTGYESKDCKSMTEYLPSMKETNFLSS